MNILPLEKRAHVLHLLVEGVSLRAASRIADVSYNTVLKLLVSAGKACAKYQDETLRNLSCLRLELDEIWSFVYAKQKHVTPEMRDRVGGMIGDVWTWTAICSASKLVPSWLIGPRTIVSANAFVADLESRLKGRVQITTDGLKQYIEAIDQSFGTAVDYAMLVKIYGETPEGTVRYSPPEYIKSEARVITGHPEGQYVSTSYAERQNLSMRMGIRRFTRLTNGFSKRVENHAHAVALCMMHYNFARIHQSLRVTPAMEAGVEKHLWTIQEIAKLV